MRLLLQSCASTPAPRTDDTPLVPIKVAGARWIELSPVLVAGALASVRHLKTSDEERRAQQAAAAMLKGKFADARLPVMDSSTHIVPLLVGCPLKAKRISDILLAEYGLYVQPINYPTVPRGTERLRFTPGPWHDEAMQDELTGALVEVWDRLELKAAA